MKNITFVLVCTLLLSLTACSDDETEIFEPETTTDFNLSDDFLLGRRLFLIYPWEDKVVIPVANDQIPDFEFSGRYFNWEIKEGKDRRFLVLTLKEGVKRKAFLEKVPVRGLRTKSSDETAGTDTLYFVAQLRNTGAADNLPSYMSNVGKTINVTKNAFATPHEPMFNLDEVCDPDAKALVITTLAKSYGREMSGVRYEELTEEMFQNLNLSVRGLHVPHKQDINISNYFGATIQESLHTINVQSNKYEYHFDMYVKPMVELHFSTGLYTNEDNPDIYLPYLNQTAVDLLNNPSSVLYKQYTNDSLGIAKLYEDYGTHVLAGGVFGGYFCYIYGRKENIYYESTAVSATVELTNKAKGSPTGPNANWLQTYYATMGSHGGNIGAGGGEEHSELHEQMEAGSSLIVAGGNASENFESWDASIVDENSNLALVGYGPSDDHEKCYLIPLYYLAKDKERRKALEEYLASYVESNALYLQKPRLVVADFMMLHAKNGHVEQPSQRVMVGPNGTKKRIYTPLVTNSKAPGDERWGCLLETSSSNYIAVSDKIDQYWWVALDFYDECDPIVDIRFLVKDDARKAGYTIRGDDADSKMNWNAIDNHYVSLKFANDTEREAGNVISGVGIARKSGDTYYVIASSPGTDMLMPYSMSQPQFERFWGSKNYTAGSNERPYIFGAANPKSPREEDGWFGEHKAGHHDQWLLPVFTKETLTLPIKTQKPENW